MVVSAELIIPLSSCAINTPTENKSSAQNGDDEEDGLANKGHLLFRFFDAQESVPSSMVNIIPNLFRQRICPRELDSIAFQSGKSKSV